MVRGVEFFGLGLNLQFSHSNQPHDLPAVTHFPFIVSCTYLVISHLKLNGNLMASLHLKALGAMGTTQLPNHWRSTVVINISGT